jgi:hypothetical protein
MAKASASAQKRRGHVPGQALEAFSLANMQGEADPPGDYKTNNRRIALPLFLIDYFGPRRIGKSRFLAEELIN